MDSIAHPDLRVALRRRLTQIRASGLFVWTGLLGRAALFMLALLVLAWIGRAKAAATSSSIGNAPSPVALDAGAAIGEAAPPSPMPIASVNAPPTLPPTPTPQPAPSPSPAASSGHARATPDDPVFVNQASFDELRRLPGVGAKRAEAIINLRQRVGRFQRVEDLMRVKGVGRATIRKWRPLIRLDAVVAAPSAASAGQDAG